MKKIAVLIIFIFICQLNGQEDKVEFENISTFSGLSASRAKCILQDSDGYIWVGTMNGGLNRYDGYSFKVYKHSNDDSTSISHDNVFSIAEDKSGNLWIATNGGVSKYIKNEDKFKNYNFRNLLKEIPSGFHSVFEIFIDSKERIWVGDSYFGTLLYNDESNSFIPIPQMTRDKIDSLPRVCGDITEDKNGTIWASGGGLGLFYFDEEDKIFRSAKMDPKDWNLLRSKIIFRILADSENNIWVMTTTNLYKYNTSSQELTGLIEYIVSSPINNGLEGELWEDDEGSMYVVHINLPNPIKFPDLSDEYVILDSKNMYPTDFLIDSFGIIWVSDWIQGLHKYVSTKQTFHQLKYKTDDKTLSGGRRIIELSQSLKNRGLLFIYSKEYGKSYLNSYNLNNGEYKEYKVDDLDIARILSNKDGSFWLGLWDGGLVKWNPYSNENEKYFNDSSKEPNLVEASIPSLKKDDNGNLWIGTLDGLYRMGSDEEEIKQIIPEHAITAIYFDENILWAGTYGGGFIKYNLNSKKMEIFQHDKFSTSLSNNIVWDIFRDKEGFLWLATEDGLNRFDLRTNQFEVFRESDGLGSSYIAAIIPDDFGSFWMSTNAGISFLHEDSKKRINFSNYDAMDGLLNPNFRHPIKFKDDRGRMYFGGNNGLYYFTPKKSKSLPPVTHLTDVLINGKSEINSLNNDPETHESGELKLDLTYENNTLTLEFIALHFAQPNKNKYAYYLEGYDLDWINTNKRIAQYIDLDPGEYKFHLRSANRDGIWSSEEITLSINISDPWWNTWYAYMAYFVIFVGLLFSVRKFELNRRNELESKRLLEAENFRKSKELDEARSLQLSMLPREVPKIPNLDIATYMKTATEVGGDYYDFNVGLEGTFTAVVGDATGHGMRAGTMVTSTKNLFSSYAENDDIINTFHEMTRCIKNMNLENLSMCMTMIKINENRVRISSAGMPPVYIYKKRTSAVEEYLFEGMPLGTMKDFPYEVKETTLESGDTILMMSDGFPELQNRNSEMLGFQQTKHLFEECALESPEDIIASLKNAGSNWINDKDPDDDVTFVVIKVK